MLVKVAEVEDNVELRNERRQQKLRTEDAKLEEWNDGTVSG